MEIFILALLILINGLFTMAEIALVSARKARLESQADRVTSMRGRRWNWRGILKNFYRQPRSALH